MGHSPYREKTSINLEKRPRGRGAAHIIHNDEELHAYTDALFKLTAKEKPSHSEMEAIELLTVLIERYEDEYHSVPEADPVSVVRYLIEKGELLQRDLIPEFGSESSVSMFLNGQRNLTIEQVQKLCARFKLPASSWSDTEPRRDEIRRGAQRTMEQAIKR
jgi:HTH-type transcriptional regulator / antitoxin HigA